MLRTIVFFASSSSKHFRSVHQFVPRPISIISIRCLADKSKWDQTSQTKSGKKTKRNEDIEKSRIIDYLKKNQQQIEELKDIRAELIKERKLLKNQIKSTDEEYIEKRADIPRSSKYKVSYSNQHTEKPSKHEYSMRVSKPERWVEENPKDIRQRYKDYAEAYSKEKQLEIEEKKQKKLEDRKLSPVVYPPVSDAKYNPLDDMRQQIINKRKTELERKRNEEATEEIRHWAQSKQYDPDMAQEESDSSQNTSRSKGHGYTTRQKNENEQMIKESHKSSVGFKQRNADSDKGSDISDRRVGIKKPSKEQPTDRPQQGQKSYDPKPGVGFTQRPKSRSDDATKTTRNPKAMLKPHKVHDYQSPGHENVEVPLILLTNYSPESNISALPDEIRRSINAQTQSSEATTEEKIQKAEDELKKLRSELIELNAKSTHDKIEYAFEFKNNIEQKINELEMELKQLLVEQEMHSLYKNVPNHTILEAAEESRKLRTQQKSFEHKFTPIDELETKDEEAVYQSEEQKIIEVVDGEYLIDQHIPFSSHFEPKYKTHQPKIQDADEERLQLPAELELDSENLIVENSDDDDIISKMSEEDIEETDASHVLSVQDESEIEKLDTLELEEESVSEDSTLYELMKSIAQGRSESQEETEESTASPEAVIKSQKSEKSQREPISETESEFEYENLYQKFHAPSSYKPNPILMETPHTSTKLKAVSESGKASEETKVNKFETMEMQEINKPPTKLVETIFAGKLPNIDSSKIVQDSSNQFGYPQLESMNEQLETESETASLTETESREITEEDDAWKHMTFEQQDGLSASDIEETSNPNNKNEDRTDNILDDATQTKPRLENEISNHLKDLQDFVTSVELEKPQVELEVIDDVSRTAQKFVVKATKVKNFGPMTELNEFGPKHELELSAQTFLRSLESFVKALKTNQEIIDNTYQDKNTDNTSKHQ